MLHITNDGMYHVKSLRKLSIFVLQCEHYTFLVGRTSLQKFTYDDIIEKCISTAARHWLTIHPPRKIYIVYPGCTSFDEDKYVKAYMFQFGIDNVRGGSYTALVFDHMTRRHINLELNYVDSLSRTLNVANSTLMAPTTTSKALVESNYVIDEKQKKVDDSLAPASVNQSLSDRIYDACTNTWIATRDIVYELTLQLWRRNEK